MAPEKGELADNRRNFDRDRLLLFDERAVFDSLLDEGLFTKMANSFLMIADVKPQEQGVCYEKYSNERRRAFQIRTEIARERDGSRSVGKYALCPEGEHHIASMEEKYRKLSEAYAGSPVDFCPCEVTRDRQTRAEFTFLQGKELAGQFKSRGRDGADRDIAAGICQKAASVRRGRTVSYDTGVCGGVPGMPR